MDDWQLLQAYAKRNDEEAFRTVVDRYAGLVYHAALRQSGNPQIAQEVTQAVFIALAQKANKISSGTLLAGWLYRATRFAFANLAREAIRRRCREQEAVTMQEMMQGNETESLWDRIAPELDEALDRLSTQDREAILIRFFQNKSHKELGQMLGVSEEAAKVRISRALKKLRTIFVARGIGVSSGLLLAALSACASQSPPPGLTAAVVSVAAGKVPVATTSTLTITKGILKIMAWTKAKIAIAAATAVILASGTTTTILIQKESAKAKAEIYSNGINNTESLSNVLYTYPDGDEETHAYIEKILKMFRPNLDPAVTIKSDQQVSEEDLRTQTVFIYGSPQNHKLLERFRNQLPIVIEDDGIVVGNKKCKGLDVGVIFICPNPVNPENQLVVYGAVSPQAVKEMNSVFHGPTDYVVFNNTTRQHSQKMGGATKGDFLLLGSFDKSDPTHWRATPKLQLLPSKDLQRDTAGVIANR